MDAAIETLLRRGPLSRGALQDQLGVSQPTLSRRIAAMSQVLSMGRARATRYGLRRNVRDLPSALPLYRIDADGRALQIGTLHAVHGGWWFEDAVAPRDSAWFDGLPWFLADMRPQGFLGAGFARRHPELGLPERLADWQDDHALYALARRGEDASGNLILGEESLARWASAPDEPVDTPSRNWPRLAEAALAGEHGISSAGGEQPKFAVLADTESGPTQLLVKFSEPVHTPAGRRWADLLIAEYHALACIGSTGLSAATARLFDAGDRMFLEVQRFDRVGARGRRGLISLGAVDDQFVGQRRRWLDTALELQRQRRLDVEDVQRVAWLQAFGEMIGNTDMHFGNLSLHYEGHWPAEVAPCYDMLPMLYAPRRSEVRTPVLTPRVPLGGGLQIARAAQKSATMFWQAVAADSRVSADFREVSRRNAATVAALRW